MNLPPVVGLHQTQRHLWFVVQFASASGLPAGKRQAYGTNHAHGPHTKPLSLYHTFSFSFRHLLLGLACRLALPFAISNEATL